MCLNNYVIVLSAVIKIFTGKLIFDFFFWNILLYSHQLSPHVKKNLCSYFGNEITFYDYFLGSLDEHQYFFDEFVCQ